MDDNQLDSTMKKLRHSIEEIPTRTNKAMILKELNQKKPRRNKRRVWMYVATGASLLIFSLLLISTFQSFNFNQLFTTGSGSKQVLVLSEVDVEIHADVGRLGSYSTIIDGEREQLVPTAISYKFKLKNNGNHFIGNVEGEINEEEFTYENGIELMIEPNDQLVSISAEVLGFNLFNPDGRLGSGSNGPIYLEPNQEGDYELHFTIGAAEANPELPLLPSEKELNKLLTNALEAELIVHVSDEEIARFQLDAFK